MVPRLAPHVSIFVWARKRVSLGHTEVGGSPLETVSMNRGSVICWRRAAMTAMRRPLVDVIAQTIRSVDGTHTMGAGELAEHIAELFSRVGDPARIERLMIERDTALDVASKAMREAFTEQVYDNGQPVGSLAELAHVEVESGTANFRIQYSIADELRRWLVPPSHRPTCPLDQQPCTSWTCLVDVCVDAKKDGSLAVGQ